MSCIGQVMLAIAGTQRGHKMPANLRKDRRALCAGQHQLNDTAPPPVAGNEGSRLAASRFNWFAACSGGLFHR